ncbi:MAG: class I SAM-dependent methyltransferase [Actinomycetota bacterium]
MSSQWELLQDVIPTDRAEQTHSRHYASSISADLPAGAIVLDLGCGTGRSRKVFRQAAPHTKWIGVDIPDSPEAASSGNVVRNSVHFDGIQLPFSSESIDCVYSNQVLEHVRHPEVLLAEVERILKPGAPFIGSTSHLEPYHSRSYWNFTPYGLRTIIDDAGLQVLELRPGIDGPTLIERQLRGKPKEMSRFFSEESPVNTEIRKWGRRRLKKTALVNNRMLQFCGHVAFHAVKPTG